MMQRHISPLGAWALAVGTSIGWGSLVVTANTYLAQSGPMGSVIGMVIGALIMLVIAWNYAYMMRSYPEAGGIYTYTREVFGYDQGFLAAWFLAMVYFAILWANATSLPLFSRIFFGDVFRFGQLYTIFGFSLLIMLTNHSYMNRRAKESEAIDSIDPMTGVKNKHAYIMNEKNMDTAITDGSAQEFSLVVCDVNGLKKINDTLGHKAGDDYIREACRLVCGTFKHSPVYRIGGDEFAVILTGHDYTSREGLVQELHDQSVANIGMGGAVISAGSSDYRPGQDKVLQDVFDRADKKMYEEKQALKNLGAVTRD